MPAKPLSELEAQIGDEVTTVRNLRVEAGKVAEFARAVGAGDLIFYDREAAKAAGYDDIPAPPTFTRIAYFPRYRPEGVDENLGFDLGLQSERILHGEQSYTYERTLLVGDVVTGTTTLTDVYQREGSRGGTMTFCVYETAFRDRDDELVLTEGVTRIETGGDAEDDA